MRAKRVSAWGWSWRGQPPAQLHRTQAEAKRLAPFPSEDYRLVHLTEADPAEEIELRRLRRVYRAALRWSLRHLTDDYQAEAHLRRVAQAARKAKR